VIGENILESVEYAVDHLKVPLVMVLSHDDCGVMKAAKAMYPKEPDHLQLLIRSVYEIIDSETECYNELARDYTLTKKRKLLKRSAILRQAHSEGKFEIVRGYLSFEDGKVSILN
jgi:carbonate dehydratase